MSPRVFVEGIAVPQGSKTRGRHGGLFEKNAAKLEPWRDRVAGDAAKVWDRPPIRDAIILRVRFIFLRPKGHLRKDSTPRPSAPRTPAVRPDIDKLLRAVLDALTGVVFADDGQVVQLNATKEYGNVAGVSIHWDVLR